MQRSVFSRREMKMFRGKIPTIVPSSNHVHETEMLPLSPYQKMPNVPDKCPKKQTGIDVHPPLYTCTVVQNKCLIYMLKVH